MQYYGNKTCCEAPLPKVSNTKCCDMKFIDNYRYLLLSLKVFKHRPQTIKMTLTRNWFETELKHKIIHSLPKPELPEPNNTHHHHLH